MPRVNACRWGRFSARASVIQVTGSCVLLSAGVSRAGEGADQAGDGGHFRACGGGGVEEFALLIGEVVRAGQQVAGQAFG